MIFEIVAVIVLVVVGGGIAYLADWLGLTMGKKRLTLLGMRPRNTARFVTVVAGALIAGLTFALLLAMNRGFRIAVQQGDQLIQHNYELRSENIGLQRQANRAQSAADQAKAQAASEDQRRTKAESRLAQVNTQLTQAQASLKQVHTQMAAVQTELVKTSSALSNVKVELAEATVQSATLAARNAQVQKHLAQVEGTVLPSIIKKNQSALVYRYGAEIGRTVIKAGQPIPIIQAQVNSFLSSLSADALGRGASVGENGRAVQVATVVISTQHSGAEGHAKPDTTFAGEQTNIAALAGQIHAYEGGTGSVVVIARTAGNSFAGEQVYVTLSPYANRLVIKQGDVLGELTVPDAENDPEKILTLIQKSLILEVHASAMKAGVIPVVNPQLHEAQLGGVTLTDLYKVVDQVRHTTGDTLITVSAAQDTYSADQLHLAFTVTPATAVGN